MVLLLRAAHLCQSTVLTVLFHSFNQAEKNNGAGWNDIGFLVVEQVTSFNCNAHELRLRPRWTALHPSMYKNLQKDIPPRQRSEIYLVYESFQSMFFISGPSGYRRPIYKTCQSCHSSSSVSRLLP